MDDEQPSSAHSDRFGDAAKNWFRTWAFPLFLIVVCPPAVAVLWIAAVPFEGELSRFLSIDFETLAEVWPWPSWAAAKILFFWVLLQVALLLGLPAKIHEGPPTPQGNRPVYRLNGLTAFFATHALLYVASYQLGWFSPTIVYDNFGSLLMTSSVLALLFCAFLLVKGSIAPSTSDASRSGSLIWDYFWGVELHPSLFGVNLKQLINCRIAMMGWSVILFSFAAAQIQNHGHLSNSMAISVGLQVLYIIKFFHWEGGYFNTLDIMHDRFGFYICWGVLAWLPSLYTIAGLYLVGHPYDLPTVYAIALVAIGVTAIWVNYDADAQRQRVRATQGETTVWGRKPTTIEAEYTTLDGSTRTNLLLVSGWWGVSRHFHYVPEITLAVMWTLPALFDHALPYMYVAFLIILLVDRSGRDELRCRGKYGPAWEEYCSRVPYRIIPFIF